MKKLSKEEMKKVLGGYSPQQHYCGYWPTPGYTMVMAQCDGSLEDCTAACNDWCNNEPGCSNNSCNCM